MTTKGSQAAGMLQFLRRCGAKPAVAVILLISAGAAPSWAAATPRKPKVRAITAFIRIDRDHYAEQIQQALAILRQAKAGFEKSGYEVETIRITTQPFPQYIQGLPKRKALEFFKALDDVSRKESFIPNIGPAMVSDEDDPAQVELLSEILATTGVFASVVVAGEDGLHWKSIRAAAKLIKYVEDHSPKGLHNFDFAATAMLPPHTPFYPGAYHNGPGHQFSVGLEGGNFVADIFAEAHGDNRQAAGHLTRELSEHARLLEAIAVQVEKDSGWGYVGLDATPAPNFDSSIGAAIEKLTGTKFGSSGTLTTAALITQALRSLAVKRAGYSGLMLPVLEDPVLAQRWSEGTYNIDSLLAYSAVCGTGLDTVVLPGEVSQQQLEKIIGDVASLAFKWHKPLTARLIPVPGKKAGEHTEYGGPNLVNTTLQPLP
jgi:uncharacterized protein (UPF0210 family)